MQPGCREPHLTVLCSLNYIVLKGFVQFRKVGRITGDPNNEITVFIRPPLRLSQRVCRDDVELHVKQIVGRDPAQDTDETLQRTIPLKH